MGQNTPQKTGKSGSTGGKPAGHAMPGKTGTGAESKTESVSVRWYLGPLLCCSPSSQASINSIAFPEGSGPARTTPFMVIMP